MKAGFHGTSVELEPNSRPYLLKRMVADGFDVIVIFALFLLFTWLLLKTPLAEPYHRHEQQAKAIEQTTAADLANDAGAVGAALSENAAYRDARFAANLHSYLLKAAACFLAEAIVLLAFPFLNRNRATPGKRMTGLMPFNERRQSRATSLQITGRFFFVLLLDSFALYLYTGILTFLLVPVIRMTEMLLNRKKNKTLCDYVTGVMIIEKLSYDGFN